MRRDVHNDFASMSFPRHVPTRFLINQCQIITFLILKSDSIENARTELKGIVLPVPSNQIKGTFIIILLFHPTTWYICDFFLFHIEIEGKCGWIIGWGQKGMLTPSQIIGGPGPLPRPPPPSLFLGLCPFTRELPLSNYWGAWPPVPPMPVAPPQRLLPPPPPSS